MPNPLLDALLRSMAPAYGVAQDRNNYNIDPNMLARSAVPLYGAAQDLGIIRVNPNNPPQQMKQAPVPMQQPPIQGPQIPEGFGVRGGVNTEGGTQVATKDPNAQKWFQSDFFKSTILPMLPSLFAVGVGSVVPDALAGAAGFSQGYAGGYGKEMDRQLEEDKVGLVREERKNTKQEKDIDQARNMALEILKADPARQAIGILPQDIERLTNDILKIQGKSSTEIGKEVANDALAGTSQYKIGQEIYVGGKKYKITGLSNPSDPDIEEIK